MNSNSSLVWKKICSFELSERYLYHSYLSEGGAVSLIRYLTTLLSITLLSDRYFSSRSF